MIACADVHYEETEAVAACLLFRDWSDGASYEEVVQRVPEVAPYEPGRFYRRELPPLLSVIGKPAQKPRFIIVDGYVWLGDESHPGLGAYLFEALGGTAAVIGVAKNLFREGPAVRAITRGRSRRPLYVSAAGMEMSEAARHVAELHGEFRIPTLLNRVDRLCRR